MDRYHSFLWCFGINNDKLYTSQGLGDRNGIDKNINWED